ncbi:MAG TPA: FAD-binding oxidoreductase [Natronosporangium sp.]
MDEVKDRIPETMADAVTVAGLAGGAVRLEPAQLAELSAAGRVLRTGQPGWVEAVRVWNGGAARTPALVVQPGSAAEVAAAVRFAGRHRLRLSVKSGGHSIAGLSLADGGLALDLSRLRELTVDPAARLARVGPGCRLGDVDRATNQHGLATVLGFVSKVGVAGLVLGGGLGYLTRRFGWGVDNLAEAEIVTADGEIRTASPDQHPDLFWAVRGAGANFGVVTRLTLRLHEVGPNVFGGLICWPFDRVGEVMATYRRLTATAPRELAGWLVMLRAPAAPFVPPEWHGQLVVGMVVCYSGPLAGTETALAPIRALGAPVFDLLAERPYPELQSMLDDTEPDGQQYYWHTEYLTGLSDELLELLPALLRECPIPDGDIGILHLGGALNERAADDGAVGNRDVRYVVGIKGQWAPGEPAGDEFRRWIRAAGHRVRPFTTGRTYINFQTAHEGEARVRATYGDNLDRLLAVKRMYDPENLFRENRNLLAAG